MIFKNRTEAGKLLGMILAKKNYQNSVIFGLARGGVITAAAVAAKINAPLEVLVVRKLASPVNPELGFGAIAPSGVEVINWETAEKLDLTPTDVKEISKKEQEELTRRLFKYRGNKKYDSLKNRVAILVDDGIATGVSMRAAIVFVETLHPDKIIVATPVCAADTSAEIKKEVDKVICLNSTENFWAVGQFYEEFTQTTDEEVIKALKQFQK